MSYIQRTMLCEDVDIQTSILVFRDTATFTEKDQKSIAIVTSLRVNSWLAAYNKLHSEMKNHSLPSKLKLSGLKLSGLTDHSTNPFTSYNNFFSSIRSSLFNKRTCYSTNPKSTSFAYPALPKWDPMADTRLRQSSPSRYSTVFKNSARQTEDIQSCDGCTGMEYENPFTEGQSFPGLVEPGTKMASFLNNDYTDSYTSKLTSSCDTKPRLFRTSGNLNVKGDMPFSNISMRHLNTSPLSKVVPTPDMPLRVSIRNFQRSLNKLWRSESPIARVVTQTPCKSSAIMTQTLPEKRNTCVACTSVSHNDLPKKECAVITDSKDPVLTLTGIKVLSISSSVLTPKEVTKVTDATCTNSGIFGFEESTSLDDLPTPIHLESSPKKVSANIGTVETPRKSFGMATSVKKIETVNRSVGMAITRKTPITIISIGSDENQRPSTDKNVNKTNCYVQYDLDDFSNNGAFSKHLSTSVNTVTKHYATRSVQPVSSTELRVLESKNTCSQSVQYVKYADEEDTNLRCDTGTSMNLVTNTKGLSAAHKSVHVQYSSIEDEVPSRLSAGVVTDATSTQSVGEMTAKTMTDSKNKNKVDATIQYSNYNSIYSTPRSTKIGRSQLMSVFALCKSVREMSTQISPSVEQETSVKLEEVPKMSQSVQSTMTHTSRFDVGDPAETLSAPLRDNMDVYITSQRSSKTGYKQPLSVFALCNSMKEIATQMTPITEQEPTETLDIDIPIKKSEKMPLQPVKPNLHFDPEDSSGTPLTPIVENAENVETLNTGNIMTCGHAHLDSENQNRKKNFEMNYAKIGYPMSYDSSLLTHNGILTRSPLWLPKALSSCTYKHKRRPRSPTFKLDSTLDAHLICLSRLMGKPTRYSCRSESSSLNAAKWIRRCGIPLDSQLSKEYQSVLDVGKVTSESLKQDRRQGSCRVKTLMSPASSQKFHKSYLSTSGMPEPLMTLSRDSLADVLPARESTLKISIALSSHAIEVAMVDKVTSDISPTKELKECELQATPDICDAATDSVPIVLKHHMSASALTSRVVLLPCHCKGHENFHRDCMFIYDKPRCLVHHKSLTDVSIQRHVSNRDIGLVSPEMETRKEHAVDEYVGSVTSVATTCCFRKLSDRSYDRSREESRISQPKGDVLVDEVLSPRVYKALYETSKLVAKALPRPYSEVSHITHTGMATDNYETSNLSTQIFTPDKLSAAILTSRYSCQGLLKDMDTGDEPCCKRSLTSAVTSPCEFESRLHCSISTQPDSMITFTKTSHHKDGVTQYCSSCRARLLEMPHAEVVDTACGSFEECMKNHLMGSCRYYSSLLTRHIGRVKETLAKQLIPEKSSFGKSMFKSDLSCMQMCPATKQRQELSYHIQQSEKGCFQTPEPESTNHSRKREMDSLPSCYINNALSTLEICGEDKENLKLVYYTLSAIEGRIRRLRRNMPY
ncbi:uncharacterized protein LOC126366576 [Pectinophora gossypiella]|uniref:uncharacterized protein LOC126366576 n=1 Tax=Pectinophora gossypiella TaxID=13191 RepID=UPI00214E41D4|nr:uncharacterized protein LOC126366576 [Pectinophora gossypiella]